MKKLLLGFAYMLAVAQNVGAQEASNFARLYVGAVEPQYPKSSWHDIPYYKGNTNFYKGRVSYHGVVYDDVKLRFDLLKQCVVVSRQLKERFVCLSRNTSTGLKWMVTGMCMIRRIAYVIPLCFVTAALTGCVCIIVYGTF